MEQGKNLSTLESPLVDFDAVCVKLRAALEPARAHAVSLHDENGDVLWLSESSMGPDEHNAVHEALEAFSADKGPTLVAYDLGNSRSALLLRAVNANRALVGAIMIVMDTRGIKQDGQGLTRMMTPKLQRALSDFAGMRPEIEPAAAAPRAQAVPAPAQVKLAAPATRGSTSARLAVPTPAQVKPAAPGTSGSTSARLAVPTPAQVKPAAPGTSGSTSARLAVPTPTQVKPAAPATSGSTSARLAIPTPAQVKPAAPGTSGSTSARLAAPLELSIADSVRIPKPNIAAAPIPAPARALPRKSAEQAITPEIDRLNAALRGSPIALHVQRLVPLIKGGQLKRYEVLLRSKSEDAPNSAPHAMLKTAVDNGLGSMIDRRVITELIKWLVHHPDVWQAHAVMFSVNLTTTALHDEHFIKFVDLCLAKSSLPKAMIAFEIDVPTAIHVGDRMSDIAAALHRLGCPIVLDDFGMRTECFDLLRLPAVRYIKLAPSITANMRSDKLSQAAITAVVQMARVLGMHTVAKHTETAAEQEWLTALGVDFIQSNAFSPSVAIETLSKA